MSLAMMTEEESVWFLECWYTAESRQTGQHKSLQAVSSP